MSVKTDTEVIIGGKVFTLSGYESEEYLQKVASYINNKLSEYNKVESFRRQPQDTQNVLMQLNLADDYFKAKKQISLLEEEIQSKEKELYNLKHELIASQIKLENMEKNIKGLQTEVNDSARKIVRLETELKKLDKQQLRLYDLLEQEVYTKELFLERNNAISDRRKKINATIAQEREKFKLVDTSSVEERLPLLRELLTNYHSLSAAEKNSILKNFVKKIEYKREKSAPEGDIFLKIYYK